jgi:uncharacterized protein with GYD domain
MPTYIWLGHFTALGLEKVKGSPARIDTTREVMDRVGASLKAWYVVTGQYDFIAIFEAPDDETVARLALAVAAHGNIRTETVRAFTEAEYRQLLTALPY